MMSILDWISDLMYVPPAPQWTRVKVFTCDAVRFNRGTVHVVTLAYGYEDEKGNRKLEETRDGERLGLDQNILDWVNKRGVYEDV